MLLALVLFLAAVLFLTLPLRQALYSIIPLAVIYGAASFVLRQKTTQAQRLPPQNGLESLNGKLAEVVSLEQGVASKPTYLVRCQGELWTATSEEALEVGEQVRVVSTEGIKLVVRRFH